MIHQPLVWITPLAFAATPGPDLSEVAALPLHEQRCDRACALLLGAGASWVLASAGVVVTRHTHNVYVTEAGTDTPGRLRALNHTSTIVAVTSAASALSLGVGAAVVRW